MYQALLALIFLLPVIVIGAILYSMGRGAAKKTRELETLAAQGDPTAKLELMKLEKTRAAMRRLARGGDDPERQRLLAQGQKARATIVSVNPLGMQIAPEGQVPRRMVEATLSVDLGGGASRSVLVVDVVSEPLLGRMLVGATVPARVDAFDPEKIVVLWDHL